MRADVRPAAVSAGCRATRALRYTRAPRPHLTLARAKLFWAKIKSPTHKSWMWREYDARSPVGTSNKKRNHKFYLRNIFNSMFCVASIRSEVLSAAPLPTTLSSHCEGI